MKTITHDNSASRASAVRSSGFTLVELLMAMFILAVGLIGVVSVFPVATYLQRESFDQVMTLNMTRNVRALLTARGIDEDEIDRENFVPDEPNLGGNESPKVHPVPDPVLRDDWPLSMRSYPMVLERDDDPDTFTPNTDEQFDEDPEFKARQFYWIPLIRDAAAGKGRAWEVYVFIVKKEKDRTYFASGTSQDTSGLSRGEANRVDPNEVPRLVHYEASIGSNTVTVELAGTGAVLPTGDLTFEVVAAGDQFLTSDGRIMTALASRFDPASGQLRISIAGENHNQAGRISGIWCVPYARGSSLSPTMRILAFGQEAVQ